MVHRGHETIAPSWRNEVTLRSVEMLGEYVPADYIAYISPTPLLLLPAVNDVLTPPTDLAIAAFEKAREPSGSRSCRRALRHLHQRIRAVELPGPGLVRPAPGPLIRL